MVKSNKHEEISSYFNLLTEENKDYALAIVRGMVYDQDNESEGGMLPRNGRYDGPSLN